MENRRVLVVVVALATVVAGVGIPFVGAASQATETPTKPNTAPMGTQLSAFMQHSAAQANDSVEDGMWAAAFDRANEAERASLATARAEDLRERAGELEAEQARLQERRENGEISETAFAARASEVNGRIDALRAAVNGTARVVQRAGVDVDGLETLKQNASELTGPEVAGVARGLAGVNRGPPEDAGPSRDGPPTAGGPPTDAGPPTDQSPPGDGNGPQAPGSGNGTEAQPGGDTPGGNGPGGGDGPPGGPPDGGEEGNEAGGSDGNEGNGPGDGSGPGQGNGPEQGN